MLTLMRDFFSLTCLLGAEVLQRVASRVGVQQQDGEREIGMPWDDRAVLEMKKKHDTPKEAVRHIKCSNDAVIT